MHSRRPLPQEKLLMRSLFFGNWVRIHSRLLNCSHVYTPRCSFLDHKHQDIQPWKKASLNRGFPDPPLNIALT